MFAERPFRLHKILLKTVKPLPRFGSFCLKGAGMTDKEVKHFYNSAEWKHKRIRILERDLYECQDCKARLSKANRDGIILSGDDRKIRRAVEVHHIKELKERPDLALEDDNLISLCTQCHNIRHGRNPKRFVRKKKPVCEERW